MTEEKTWLTCKEAAILLNFTQRHILNLINKGKISAERDETGKYFIQKAEFFRVFPEALQVEPDGKDAKSLEKDTTKVLEEKIRHLQEMVDEKKKQNDFLTQQLNHFTEEKSKMLDAIASHTRLLEFKETSGKSYTSSKENKISKNFDWWPFKKR